MDNSKEFSKNGETYIDNKSGYRRFSDSGNFVHIWKAKRKYNLIDLGGKEVHHIDGNKLNNNEDNIILLTKGDHYLLHQHLKKFCEYSIKPWALISLIIAAALPIPVLGLGVVVFVFLTKGVWKNN